MHFLGIAGTFVQFEKNTVTHARIRLASLLFGWAFFPLFCVAATLTICVGLPLLILSSLAVKTHESYKTGIAEPASTYHEKKRKSEKSAGQLSITEQSESGALTIKE